MSLAMSVPFIPGMGALRDHGLPGFMAILLLGVSCLVLRQGRRASIVVTGMEPRMAA
jgi:hypothetical protein